MFIKVSTHNSIEANEELTSYVEGVVNSKLKPMSGRLTDVEVFLSDENSTKGGGDDIRCTVEARPRGHQPLAVTFHGANVKNAVTHALDKMRARLDSEMGKIDDPRP